MRTCNLTTLSNGILVVHNEVPSGEIVHCGVFLEIGSRDESIRNQGIAHFWEHMAFKGTKKRRAFHIINSLDSIGGEINAFTEKEKIVFYATIREKYLDRAMDVLTDITFNSVFPEREIEKERGVILEEMAMYEDDPDDFLQDEFEALIFKGHPMGMNILGNQKTVSSFTRNDFEKFVVQHLNTSRIVVSITGNVSEKKVEQLCEKYLEGIPKLAGQKSRKKFSGYQQAHLTLERTIKQSRCAIGREAFSLKSSDRIPFTMLVNLLGGPGMNSRLNLALRERYGFVYAIDAHYTAYSDTGVFAIYFGTEPNRLQKCIQLVNKELEKLSGEYLGIRQLATVKEQMKGQLAMIEESNLSTMLMMGRSILDFGKVPTLEEIFHKIDDVDASNINSVARKMFDPRKMSSLVMQPPM